MGNGINLAMILLKIIIIIFCLVRGASAYAQVYSIDPTEKGFSYSSDPTATFLWESKNAKAVLIFIQAVRGS